MKCLCLVATGELCNACLPGSTTTLAPQNVTPHIVQDANMEPASAHIHIDEEQADT